MKPLVPVLAVAMIALSVASNVAHDDSLDRVGLSPTEFEACARAVARYALPVAVAIAPIAWKNRMWAPWSSTFAVAMYPVWAFAQEYALLAFAANRLEDGLPGRERLVPWVNGLLFALAHLPNPVLMTATFVGGVVFTRTFLRHRNLLPIVAAHAVIGLLLSLAASPISGVMSVGPGYGARVGNPPQ